MPGRKTYVPVLLFWIIDNNIPCRERGNIMKNIVVCYKWVLDEQDIRVNPGDLALDTSRAKYKISDYDRNAIEAGTVLAEKNSDMAVVSLTYGTNAAKASLKDALSRGPGKGYWVNDEKSITADACLTAKVLAGAIDKIGDYGLIICGEGSADQYSQQVGPRLGALLGIPALTFVSEVHIEGDFVIATRKLGDCSETVKAKLPAVVSVLPEINKPRIPSLKQVLGAAKKPVVEWKIPDLGLDEQTVAKVKVRKIQGAVMERKNIIYKDGANSDKINSLLKDLQKEGLI